MKPIRTRRLRAGRLLLGAALFLASLAESKRRPVPAYEERVFRRVNEGPDRWRPAVRTFMQAGTYGLTPVFAALAWRARRPRLAMTLAGGGTAAWLLAKVAKRLSGRGRPAQELPGVRLRESIGGELGWVSGHAAVSTALACAAADAVPPGKPLFAAWAAEVGWARLYVGAHLPGDVICGVGLGMMVSAVVDAVVPRRWAGAPLR